MLIMTYYAYRRFALVRHATGLLAAAAAVLLAAEFALLASPGLNAQPAPAIVFLEGRYSGEPQLLPVTPAALDTRQFIEP
jgi:hypothetical protein